MNVDAKKKSVSTANQEREMTNETTNTVEVPTFNEEDVVTPSELANLVQVPAQMIYSYIKAGRINSVNGILEGKDRVQKLILKDEATTWVEKYTARKEERKNKSDEQADAITEAFEATQEA